jgi:hypothetical protein
VSQSRPNAFGFRDPETGEPLDQEKRPSAKLYRFVRNVRTFPKTAAEIRDFSYAKLTREDEEFIVVFSLRTNVQAPSQGLVFGGWYEGDRPLFSQSVHIDWAQGAHWKRSYFKNAPTRLTQQLQLVEAPDEQSEENDREITVTAGLGLVLRDSWATVREYTVSWMALWGALVQLVAWLMGGFDGQLKVTTAIVILYVITKALVHLRVGEFGLAFWRVLHFPLWMTLITIGTLGDLSHAESATSMRKVAMFFVTVWCLGGSTTAVMTLLGLKRVDHLRKGFKRLIRETFAEEDEESDGSGKIF